jgi:hypothetical protein
MSRSTGTPDAERRRLLKLAAFGMAAAPFASSLLAGEARADAPLVDEKDPTAVALGYHCVAENNPARKDADAFCQACMFYTANPDGKSGACVLFQGKSVCAKGWCTSFQKKTA